MPIHSINQPNMTQPPISQGLAGQVPRTAAPTPTAPTAPAKPSLEGFMPWLNTSVLTNDPTNDSKAQDFLGRLRAYDPNARIVKDSGGGERPDTWRFEYDNTKLPTNRVTNSHGTMGLQEMNGDYFQGKLYNDKAAWNEGPYGRVTASKNVKEQEGILPIIGPMLVMGAAGLLGGGFGALNSAGFKMGTGAVNLARSLGSGNFNPLSLGMQALGAFGGSIPGMQGLSQLYSQVSPYVRGASSLYNLYNRFGRG